ncbi:beta-N-acetylhexosaminidase [Mangrovactinospora gilvigrisea]|uniref:Beta-N-acetylhexosaminidase n=1 Tax=Mangrovactinospora gilvigrisea TaxID=1428644 RepID=A0A1J7BAS8_9ACTN|nr:beta-N-acetylglucosaminidase domain-containing protein [Mangrovactinospora gilvigrisea]OIV35799.1 beta-N-acetylhexosaminidase [Mangrovactinospora gilvigrisea]
MHRKKHRPLPLLGGLLLGAALLAAPAQAHADDPPAPAPAAAPSAPVITPNPQSEHVRPDHVVVTPQVDVVTGDATDPAALALAKSALKAAGADAVDVTAKPSPGRLAVYVGGPGEHNAASADALKALGVQGTGGLAAEGYVLAAGRAGGDGPGRIVLSGADATGTYYAAQSLRQVLPHRGRPGGAVQGLAVRDWPATGLRGVIEGFYGTPWSAAARLDQMDFYGAHKMNTYVYSPKNDPYLRDKWRDPYPADQLAVIKQLVDRATANHVDFTYALSPGLSVCYSSDTDLKALTDKFQTLWDIGVRQFAVPLDDISYTTWNCDADKARWGTGGGAAGAAQAYLLNRVNQQFIATHPGARPLQMVPTEYYDTTDSAYKTAIRTQLDGNVVVEWTGVGVVAPTMTVAQAKAAKAVFGHPILTWDNYPVNDYTTSRLLLGPFTGREQGLPEQLAGITANPMIQPYASKLALATVADFTWNDSGYDARESWLHAVHEMAGGSPAVEKALRAFADVNYSSAIDSTEAPDLSAVMAGYWAGKAPAAALGDALAALRDAPAVLRAKLPDTGFATDASPWLDAATGWAKADLAALRMVEEAKAGHGAAAWALERQLPSLVAAAKAPVYVDMNGNKVPVVVGPGVLDGFVAKAQTAYRAALGLPPAPTGQTSMGVYSGNTPDRMVDGDDSSYFWSSAAPSVGDWVGVDLGKSEPVSSVALHMSKSSSPNDYIHAGTLEYSADGTAWHQLSAFSAAPDVTADAPAGTTARYVRARVTASQDYWVVVREFTVTTADRPAVTGAPAPAAGSGLAAAADGSPATFYRGATAPAAGDALTVAYPAARTVHTVTVLANAGSADVQVRVDGAWRTVGALDGAFTRLDVGSVSADAVRLAWTAGSAAPGVAEVIAN